MEVLTLNFVAFITNLIALKQFNTILVLYDHTTRNEINVLIEILSIRYDVAWVLVNEKYTPEYWKHSTMQNRNILIFTAVQSKNISPLLRGLYNKKMLSKRPKNLIVSSDISKSANNILSSLLAREINAVLVDWSSEESIIFAWNPYGAINLIKLNESEFLMANNAVYSASGMYSGIFFDKLQNMRGRSTIVLSCYDSKNVYNVLSDSVASVDGTEIQIIDLIAEAIQSFMSFYVIKTASLNIKMDPELIDGFLEQTYKTYIPIQRRQIQDLTINTW